MIRVLHWLLIVSLFLEVLYCGVQVMVVLQPDGISGPMFGRATSIPYELLVARRLYAIEGWVSFGSLAIYLAITELRPRLHPEAR